MLSTLGAVALTLMTSLSPIQQAVLDKIASGETSGGNGYSEIFGGRKFQSFTGHPNIKVPVGDGQYTTAAGRYQMTLPTWQAQKARLGLKDFSPASQDAAALDLAQRTYQQNTGRDLISDTAAGRTNWSALSNQWTSLKGKSSGPTGATQLASNPLSLPAQLSPSSQLNPNPQPEPGFQLGTLRAALPGVFLTPVDHDPWSLAPTPSLLPISHDPFQKEASNAP